MSLGGGCDEGIHCMYGPTEGVMSRNQTTPFISDRAVNLQDTLLEPKWQFATQPFTELFATFAG